LDPNHHDFVMMESPGLPPYFWEGIKVTPLGTQPNSSSGTPP